MCGILLSKFTTPEQASRKRSHFDQCLKQISHRGPDDSDVLQVKNILIGHTRLAIIDIDKNKQPATSPCDNFCLSFNGEIYNYKRLRIGLEKKWDFKTKGDTEVLLAGLTLEGTRFIEKLEGMWAFAFYDKKQDRLILSRDIFGKKPLYYSHIGAEIHIASEIPPLLKLIPQKATENIDSALNYIKHGFYEPSTTIFNEIREILPGTVVEVSGNTFNTNFLWSPPNQKFGGSYTDALKECKNLVCESIEKRLVADVEIGVLLSGGIDSSLITSILVKEFGITPKTFTLKYKHQGYDESHFASSLARDLNIKNVQVASSRIHDHDVSKLTRDHIGQPFGDFSTYSLYQISKAASEELKVVLAGDGCDEIFSGYQRYQAALYLKHYYKIPSLIRNTLEQLSRYFEANDIHPSKSYLKKVQLFTKLANEGTYNKNYKAPPSSSLKTARHLLKEHIIETASIEPISMMEMMQKDIRYYLPQDILLKSDRASMANGLEIRSPFLDRKLVDFSLSLKSEWHRKKNRGKRILYDAFKDYLPDYIWRRKKQGFSGPVGSWLNKKHWEFILNNSDYYDHIIDRNILEQIINEQTTKKDDHSAILWNIFVYCTWKYSDKT